MPGIKRMLLAVVLSGVTASAAWALDAGDVVQMLKSGVQESVIINMARNQKLSRPLVAQEVIALSAAGASPTLLEYLTRPEVVDVAYVAPAPPTIVQTPPTVVQSSPAVVAAQPQVVVASPPNVVVTSPPTVYYNTPSYVYPRSYYGGWPYYGSSYGVSINVNGGWGNGWWGGGSYYRPWGPSYWGGWNRWGGGGRPPPPPPGPRPGPWGGGGRPPPPPFRR